MFDAMRAGKNKKEKENPRPTEQEIEIALAGTSFDGKTISQEESKKNSTQMELDSKEANDAWEETLPNGRVVRVKRVIVDPNDVHVEDTSVNKRASFPGLQKLCALLKETSGNTQAIGIVHAPNDASHTNPYEIIWGKRRTKASKLANLHLKANLYLDKLSATEAGLLAAMENAGRKDPNYFEKADIYKSLIDNGYSKISIAQGENMSRQQLDKLLNAHIFPDELRQKIQNIDTLPRAKCIELGKSVATLKNENIQKWEAIYNEYIKKDYLDPEEFLNLLNCETGEMLKPNPYKLEFQTNSGTDVTCELKPLKEKAKIAITLKNNFSEEQLKDIHSKFESLLKEL